MSPELNLVVGRDLALKHVVAVAAIGRLIADIEAVANERIRVAIYQAKDGSVSRRARAL